MTQGERFSLLAKQLVRPVFLGLIFAVWGALVYTGGPAGALFSGEWQINLAGRGWAMTAFYLAMTLGGLIAPFFAIWYFHKGMSQLREIRRKGLENWLERQNQEWMTEIRKRSEESIRATRDRSSR